MKNHFSKNFEKFSKIKNFQNSKIFKNQNFQNSKIFKNQKFSKFKISKNFSKIHVMNTNS